MSSTRLAGADGSSNTILLAHKGMDTREYSRNASASNGYDITWAGHNSQGNPIDLAGYFRLTTSPQRDTVDPTPDSTYLGSGCLFANTAQVSPERCHLNNISTGSPHEGGMPVLFGDGSVRSIRYGISQTMFEAMVFWNDGQIVNPAQVE